MGYYSSEAPLLSNGYIKYDLNEKKSQPLFKLAAKWVLKLFIWAIFVAWISLMFLYPTSFVNDVFFNVWVNATESFYGLTGSMFFAFTAPVIILAILAMLYLVISQEDDELQEKKTLKRPSFRLWTFPVMVNGAFGVVTAAELIGILMVAMFIIFTCGAYGVRIFDWVSTHQLTGFAKSCYILEVAGAKVAVVGLFCLSLLFLPVSRGSMLLRLVDIPFEHAARYHVWLGHVTMVIFSLHGLLYVILWALKGELVDKILEWPILLVSFPLQLDF